MGLYTGLCYVMCEILLFFSTKKDPTNRYRLDNFNGFFKIFIHAELDNFDTMGLLFWLSWGG